MARRPTSTDFDKLFTKEEISELRCKIAKLASYEIKIEYERVYDLCRMDSDRLPSARSIQQLVTIWRVVCDNARKRKPTRG